MYTTVMLNNGNYLKWKVQVCDALNAADYWYFTNPMTAPAIPAQDGPAKNNWVRVNSLICGMIRSRCEEVPRSYIEEVEVASVAWTTLRDRLKPRGSGPLDGTFDRLEALSLAKCTGLQDYADKFQATVNELHQYSPNLFTTWLVHRFHSGLGNSAKYDTYKTQYRQHDSPFEDNGNPRYDLEYAMGRVLRTFVHKIDSDTNLAMVAAVNSASQQQSGIRPGMSTRVITKTVKHCTHCGKDYHTIVECTELHPELRRNNKRNNRGSNKG
ncbi:MAG: hypothetical protein Q9228_007381, partial [Teloschistes exilis]